MKLTLLLLLALPISAADPPQDSGTASSGSVSNVPTVIQNPTIESLKADLAKAKADSAAKDAEIARVTRVAQAWYGKYQTCDQAFTVTEASKEPAPAKP
jgi:hypothetical protein